MKKKIIIKAFFVFLLSISMLSCDKNNGQKTIDGILHQVEYLMEDQPDSALLLLNEIDADKLKNSRIKARYALLKSMALDKNYIDTTTFDVLQPAIDYYLRQGNPDDKLKTLYYQGVIYQNAGKDDLAMQSYLKSFEIKGSITDSLTLARLLVAQGTLYSKQYKIKECIINNFKAAEIYNTYGRISQQCKCYLRTLEGAIIISNKELADSILKSYSTVLGKDSSSEEKFSILQLAYSIRFGNIEETYKHVKKLEKLNIQEKNPINMAMAHKKVGEPEKGLIYLLKAKINPDNMLDSLTYWLIKSEILEDLDEYNASLNAFKNYARLLEVYHKMLFSNELLFSEKKHEMEVENLGKLHERDNVIKWILGGLLILLVISAFLYYRYRMNKAARLIAEQNGEKLRLEAEKLQLEADNLHLELERLEDERDRLSSLLERKDGLSDEMISVIRERLDMLNGLLAKEITKEESYAKP
ncbi:MAG: hypothetical protein K2K32_07295, partial [Muribaculaceae bacterium]|nr:hypothetical protein [Muribaculaceae bacterium]